MRRAFGPSSLPSFALMCVAVPVDVPEECTCGWCDECVQRWVDAGLEPDHIAIDPSIIRELRIVAEDDR